VIDVDLGMTEVEELEEEEEVEDEEEEEELLMLLLLLLLIGMELIVLEELELMEGLEEFGGVGATRNLFKAESWSEELREDGRLLLLLLSTMMPGGRATLVLF